MPKVGDIRGMTPFYPGTNLTSFHDKQCYGNITLCVENQVLCTLTTCDLTLASMDYIPNLGGNLFFVALFGLLLIAQLVQGVRYRVVGYAIATICGLALEIIGYLGRVLIHNDPFGKNPFLIYLVCLTIAPALLTAAIYLCLARIVVVYGEHASWFKPRTYTLLFCSCDFISLLLQAIGGAIASTAETSDTTQLGVNIMLAGLAFQVASLAVFAGACGEFAWRLRKNPQSWNTQHSGLYNSILFKAFLFSLGAATLTIFVRSAFRVAELSGGFSGPLANDEVEFMILEGTMISIACILLTVFHPGWCFQGSWLGANFSMKGRKTSGDGSGKRSEEDLGMEDLPASSAGTLQPLDPSQSKNKYQQMHE